MVFGGNFQIILDPRLRECNYGNLTGTSTSEIIATSFDYVDKPYPDGESYKEVEKRIKSFLESLIVNYSEKTIAVIAHRATQLALEVLINKKSWWEAFKDDWRTKIPKKWKPGWIYVLN